MAQKSEIEWTDATWNPVTGCTKIGPGCDNCYAELTSKASTCACGDPGCASPRFGKSRA